MRLRLSLAAAFLLVLINLSARADTLDDFVLTGDGHTATFSLPAVYMLPNPGGHAFTPTLPAYTTATLDGVAGIPLYTDFYNQNQTPGGVDLNFTSSISDFNNVGLRVGPTAIQFLSGTSNYLYILGYIPGTYHYLSGAPSPSGGPPAFTPFTLTITPEAATPEPPSWLFALTGILGIGLTPTGRKRMLIGATP